MKVYLVPTKNLNLEELAKVFRESKKEATNDTTDKTVHEVSNVKASD